jgi:uncharacterized protein (TIGR00255 family)
VIGAPNFSVDSEDQLKEVFMLNSMTGFARAVTETPFGTLTCELRTVNHRYLDVQFRLPEELRPKEIDLRNRIGESLNRGKVECALHLRRAASGESELTVNAALVKQIGARVDEITRLLPETRSVDPVDILRWPGVVVEPEIDTDPLFAEATTLLDEALHSLSLMRESEGARIVDMLNSRLSDVVAIAAGVRKRMPEVLAAVRVKQKERIDKLDVDADPARLETELALIAQKLDVDEELDRLESHVSEVIAALQKNEPVGRRLDFLMQELNREANTLGSKSADTETTNAAVALKVLIEQMREQIQNIE